MELMEQRVLKRTNLNKVGDWIGPDVGNLPHVDLPIGDDVRAGRGEVAIDASANALRTVARHLGRKGRSSRSDCSAYELGCGGRRD